MSDSSHSKKPTRRKFVRTLASGAAVTAGAGFYTTLFASTKALASAESEEDLILKKLTEGLQEKLAPIEKKSLWAGLKFGDGDKYGGTMEEMYAKKK